MNETVFTYAAPDLKFGKGASGEVGHDLASYGARRVLLVTDEGVMATGAHGDRMWDAAAGRDPAREARDIEAAIADPALANSIRAAGEATAERCTWPTVLEILARKIAF